MRTEVNYIEKRKQLKEIYDNYKGCIFHRKYDRPEYYLKLIGYDKDHFFGPGDSEPVLIFDSLTTYRDGSAQSFGHVVATLTRFNDYYYINK